jgi:signal transduction histidine kinase
MTDDIQLKLQQKIDVLERKVKLQDEGLHQAERLRRMYDRTEQELKETKAVLIRQGEELEKRVLERTQKLEAAQEELVRKEKLALLGQVVDTVGHELRNPLGVMNLAVYFLQTVLTDADETTKEYLGIIKKEIGDAERIVSDLLDAVRTKSPQPETVEVAALIAQTLGKCEVPAAVTVRMDIPERPAAIRVDLEQMQQVLWNLISNGVEAMPDGGVLEIGMSEDQTAKTVMISIKDSGSGIAPENLSKLFQPMFTTKARRVGLGLVVVKNLTHANGGSVEVESVPGKGSRFFVTLPSEEGDRVVTVHEITDKKRKIS